MPKMPAPTEGPFFFFVVFVCFMKFWSDAPLVVCAVNHVWLAPGSMWPVSMSNPHAAVRVRAQQQRVHSQQRPGRAAPAAAGGLFPLLFLLQRRSGAWFVNLSSTL
jgi:hypothetical protein